MTTLLEEVQTKLIDGTTYYLYVPGVVKEDTPIMVSVHGISRNADEHINFYVPYARQRGVILISPLFDEARYPDYQTLDQGSDTALLRIFENVKEITGSKVERFHLSGSSGGGQYSHRFMMRYPRKVERLAASAAGWYTFPDDKKNYWQGIRYSEEVGKMNPDEFLKVPSMAIVGELDDATHETDWAGYGDPNDKRTLYQGAGRYIRAYNWIQAMTKAARDRDYDTEYKFEPVAKAGHDFGSYGWCYRIFNFLFPQIPVNYGPNVIQNGGFETGNLQGWYEWHSPDHSLKAVVQNLGGLDVYEGNYKCDFYSSRHYKQSIYQELRLENGRYEVTAWVLQSGIKPTESRIELYGHGASRQDTNIDFLNCYYKIKTVIDVTTGFLGAVFYVNSPGRTRFKIDNVEVRKVL